ncbi:MAG: hypothetical protein ABR927_12760 [Bacteroidales bacterium]|jgi:hypothetical protein
MKTKRTFRIFDYPNGKSIVNGTLKFKFKFEEPFLSDPENSRKLFYKIQESILKEEYKIPSDRNSILSSDDRDIKYIHYNLNDSCWDNLEKIFKYEELNDFVNDVSEHSDLSSRISNKYNYFPHVPVDDDNPNEDDLPF